MYTMYEVWERCCSSGDDIWRKVASGLSKDGADDLVRRMSPKRLSDFSYVAAKAGFDPSAPVPPDQYW